MASASSLPTTLHLRETTRQQARVKQRPDSSCITGTFHYAPSADGTDENLLVLLHGLGDTHLAFAKLGRSLKLPQTAVLALCAPQQVPFLDEPGFQWYPSFDPLGELIPSPNPTPALEFLQTIISNLVHKCGWGPGNIHLFGFAQGGSVVGEFGMNWWRKALGHASGSSDTTAQALGSIVTICGPLLSYPTPSPSAICPTPVLVFHRVPPSSPRSPVAAYKKGYRSVREMAVPGGEDAMPRGKEEWEGIIRFWSERLGRRLDGGAGAVYEVVGKDGSES